jgi:hypothetical protein
MELMSYTEFAETLTDQQRADWAYEGVTIKELYNEYLALNQECNSRPQWAY